MPSAADLHYLKIVKLFLSGRKLLILISSVAVIWYNTLMNTKNIVLIGMPGTGKSTAGVLLAKAMRMPFIDTDLLIQKQENCYLQELINTCGINEFIKIEEKVILGLDVQNTVIATGGSAVYSEPAVRHLKSNGIFVFLNSKIYQLERRLKNVQTRGIAMKSGQTLSNLYHERLPLYKRYADIEIDCSKKHIETIVSEIKNSLKNFIK